jgi:ribosomal protein S27E
MMASNTEGRLSPFEGPALAVSCPKCGADAGKRCTELTASSEAFTEMYGTPRRYRHAKPHPERIESHQAAEFWRAMVAKSEQQQAENDALTQEQAAFKARYVEVKNERYHQLSAPKRAQGHGDCSEEWAAAEREALEVVRAEFPQSQSAPARATPPRPIGQPTRVAARPRERKAQRSRSTSSSASGDDPPDEPAPAGRRAHAHRTPKPAACQNCGCDDIVYSLAERAWLCVPCDDVVKPATGRQRGHTNGAAPTAVAASVKEIHSGLIAVQITLDVAIRELPATGPAENVQHARTAIARLLGRLECFGIEVGS